MIVVVIEEFDDLWKGMKEGLLGSDLLWMFAGH
jgi:hypothetical protein